MNNFIKNLKDKYHKFCADQEGIRLDAEVSQKIRIVEYKNTIAIEVCGIIVRMIQTGEKPEDLIKEAQTIRNRYFSDHAKHWISMSELKQISNCK